MHASLCLFVCVLAKKKRRKSEDKAKKSGVHLDDDTNVLDVAWSSTPTTWSRS